MTEPVSGWCAARRARTCERGSVKVNDLYMLPRRRPRRVGGDRSENRARIALYFL